MADVMADVTGGWAVSATPDGLAKPVFELVADTQRVIACLL
jgi:hypothetical protein